MNEQANNILRSGTPEEIIKYSITHDDYDFSAFRDAIIENGDLKNSIYFLMHNSSKGDVAPLMEKIFSEGENYDFHILENVIKGLDNLNTDEWRAAPEFDSLNDFFISISNSYPVLKNMVEQKGLIDNVNYRGLLDFAESNDFVEMKSIQKTIVAAYLKDSSDNEVRECLLNLAELPGVDKNVLIDEVLTSDFTYSSVSDFTSLANSSNDEAIVQRIQDVIIQKGLPMDMVYFASNVKEGVDLDSIANALKQTNDKDMVIQIEHLIEIENNFVNTVSTENVNLKPVTENLLGSNVDELDLTVLDRINDSEVTPENIVDVSPENC